MARQHPDDVKKELQQQEDEVYGEETISGSSPRPASDDNVQESVKDVTGNDPDDTEPFSMTDEVGEDERAIQDKPINDYAEEEQEEDDAVSDSGLADVTEEAAEDDDLTEEEQE